MEKHFRYDTLDYSRDSIRLLQILPGSPTEDIHCQIKQVPTSDRPIYCALSYCWGDPDQPKPIVVNQKRFLVHQNLWWLLKHLRASCEDRKLWIDAICIDQASIRERNHQVKMMGTIYEQADTVLAWLGPASEDSGMAFELLMNGVVDEYDAGHEVWAALANLCRREYWHRTWIIQELLLASKVELICGDMRVSWNALERIAGFMPSKPLKLIEASGVLKTLKLSDGLPFRFVKQRGKRQLAPLSTLLQTYEDSKCIDPRDKVYAMLSLASDCKTGESLLADYSKGRCQVFLDVMQFCSNIPTRERFQFGCLLLKVLKITPGTAAYFLNQRDRSGWLPFRTLQHSEHLNKMLSYEDKTAGLIDLHGKYVGSISDIRTLVPPKRNSAWTIRNFYSEAVKSFSKMFVTPAVRFSYDPITISIGDSHPGAESSRTNAASSLLAKEISILSDQFQRSTGIACGGAQVGHQVYQFEKSGLALVCGVTEGALNIVGEAIIIQSPEFSMDGGINDIQRFIVNVVDFLAFTRRGSAIDSKDGDEWASLSVVDWREHEAVSKMILSKDGGVNTEYEVGDGRTIIHHAASQGCEEVVMLLLERPAAYYSINQRGESRETALHVAASHGHEMVVWLLLEKGAAVNANNEGGNTPLHIASANRHDKVVRLLLQKGAALLWINNAGDTALQLALANKHEAVIRLLQERRPSKNEEDESGQKALRMAATYGNEAAVRLLLEKGISMDGKDEDGRTALHIAAAYGHKGVVRLLLEQGASMQEKDQNGKTALQSASWGGNEKTIELFLDKGADPNAPDEEYGNALQVAACRGHENIVQLLLEKGADVNAQGGLYGNAVQAASHGGHAQIVELLIEKGADVNVQGGFYGNALQAALFGGHQEIVRLLSLNKDK